jgi:hypothetical protein
VEGERHVEGILQEMSMQVVTLTNQRLVAAPRQLKRGREQHWATMLKINPLVASHFTRLSTAPVGAIEDPIFSNTD